MSNPPAPKPSLLRRISSDLGISLAALQVLLGALALIVAIVGIFVTIHLSKPSGSSTSETTNPGAPASTTAPPSPTPTPSAVPTPIGASSSATPTGTTPTIAVRRTTKDKLPLTLLDGHTADLDSMNPAWDVNSDREEEDDIEFWHGGLIGNQEGTELAIVSGKPNYDTCLYATGYTDEISREQAKKGVSACIKTSESRFAYITIKNVVNDRYDDPYKIQLAVVVWDH